MPIRTGDSPPSLRERKKQRTRATLVDVAARLCAQQGYGKTTVDQIAAAAEVSPRTFSRYFPSKEAVIGALMEEASDRVAEALARQPLEITEYEALVRAHVEVFRATERGEQGAMSFDSISGFLSIVNSTPMLGLASFTFRPDGSTHAVVKAIARRMGVPVTHPGVRIVFDTWAVLMAVACGTPGADASDPHTISDWIEAAYEIFTRLWRPWQPLDQPPAGERER